MSVRAPDRPASSRPRRSSGSAARRAAERLGRRTRLARSSVATRWRDMVGTADAAGPGPSTMDPRIRERRVAVARRRGRRRLALVGGAVLVPVLGAGGWLLLHTGLFSAEVVTVTGAVHTPRSAVVAAAGLDGHPPLIDVNPAAADASIERLPWVARATVTRHWPDGVTVQVVERVPRLVVARRSGGWAEVDVTGRVVATAPSPLPGLAVLRAPVDPGRPGSDLGRGANPGLTAAAALPAAFGPQVNQISVGSGGQVRMRLSSGVDVVLGSATQLPAKYEDVAALLAHVPLHAGDVVDVRVPGSPTVSGP